MRFLHVSDLHLGKRVHEYPMLEDQRVMLDSLVDVCERETPRAVVIAGDVYDRAVPSVEAIDLFEHFLIRLSRLSLPVMIVAGNHDSGERLSFGKSFLEKHRIHIAGVFDGTVPRVQVHGEAGDTVVFHLLPFIRAGMVRRFFPEREIKTVEEAVGAALSTVRRGPGRHVIVAHQFVVARGCEPLRSDSEILQVGAADEVDAALFASFDYAALGHLHGMQPVGGGSVFYAGSPLPYSFSEVGQTKGALLVDLSPDGSLSVRREPLRQLRAMRRVRGTLAELLEEGRKAVQREDRSLRDYLEVTLIDRGPVADPLSRLRDFYPHVMRLLFDRGEIAVPEEEALLSRADLAKKSPADLFSAFFARQLNRPLTEEQLCIVRDVAAEAEDAAAGGGA